MEGGRRSSGAAGGGSSSSRLSGLGSAASVAERTVPVFVPVPVSRCHTEARRHCFRIGCRRSAAAPPPPPQPGSLSPSDLAARGRQGGELGQSRRPGSGQDRSHLMGGRRGCRASSGAEGRVHGSHLHVHTSTFCGPAGGFQVVL